MATKEVQDVNNSTPRTFTAEEVNANFVPRVKYDEQVKQNEQLVRALNKLLSEYNDLHIKVLLNDDSK